MARIFVSVSQWLSECKRVIREDLDDIILVTGVEGSGKSNLAYQFGKALDPTFGLHQIGFSVPDYIDICKNLPQPDGKGKAVQCDEFLVNKRKAMRRETVDLLDFLQECRGLNLHHIICFPHVDLLDKAVYDYRVRWHVHIPKRGVFEIKERHKYFGPGGTEQYYWKVVGRFIFGPNSGLEWDAYKQAKHEHMMRSGDSEKKEDSEWDMSFLRSLPSRYQEARGTAGKNQIL